MPVGAAPFLAVDILGEAVRQHPELEGLEIAGARHVFSGFVDDSAAFLQLGRMVRPLARLLAQFGDLSGLFTQAKKCVVISAARKAASPTPMSSFPVLPDGETTRYLGILIGLGDVTAAN